MFVSVCVYDDDDDAVSKEKEIDYERIQSLACVDQKSKPLRHQQRHINMLEKIKGFALMYL